MSPSSTPQPPEATRATRGRPPRLDQARTVEAALQLLDASGLDALTMRRLADAVGAQAGALYRYFAAKQDLLTAMAERMLADCTPRSPAHGDWSEQLADLARRMRTALLNHRDGARVYAGTHATGENTLGFADTLVGVLLDAGFQADDAARAALAVVHFTVGHTLEEQAATQATDEEPADPEHLRQAVTSGHYPHLAAALPVLTSSDFTAHFEFGLRLLVRGLRSLD
ncbi:TetR/AcrR family transcriptional regulator [Streptomyces lunaelactis]|uniref:TetR/AcrR family transcriptional regulator n=1 Tax=Streptomyces lunaelactis TaxID=1535768 RepID=UPI0015852F76|nr:TetR/AcrR family transcriptional regulator [Streptomyces lunaelactis]NUK13058.1 TetR/AcrR family transcriptional regulator [Streptomyces lunaelactis]NUK32365.1 TetR/AcrR family transcriptional regulator [Streptomyces lunaelactis]NUK40465.1 TetR/AcrR family transcriptional regulator [Streptomyces lunaelactis]NUK91531.1 TetR/AcrR family transcriptional regulator [Streptomyces lunaelactis]NUL08294.1 TetR/AcrR family transcriptional regulator [Streptomyces lunaelactis]